MLEPATVPVEPAEARPAYLPGPGLAESLLWMIGALGAQVGALILALVAILIGAVVSGTVRREADLHGFLDDTLTDIMPIGTGAVAAFALIGLLLRQRPRALRRLGLRAPGWGATLLILLAVLPLSLLCGELGTWIIEWLPDSDWGMGDMLSEMMQAPFPVVVLTIAVLPAIGEELLFRGLIGRGLVARWGLVGGMALTSVLFGAIHVVPAQALAVIPLGLVMHYAYYTTRSFWGAVLVHFLNNLWASVLMKFGDRMPETVQTILATKEHVPPLLVLCSAAAVASMAWLMWQMRARYVLADGTEWTPGYATAEAPPPEAGARRCARAPTAMPLCVSALCLLGFAFELYRTIRGQ